MEETLEAEDVRESGLSSEPPPAWRMREKEAMDMMGGWAGVDGDGREGRGRMAATGDSFKAEDAT